MNWFAALGWLDPFALTTVTFTAMGPVARRAVSAGAAALMWVWPSTTKFAGVLPKKTPLAVSKLLPVMPTNVPAGPLFGESPVTVGANGENAEPAEAGAVSTSLIVTVADDGVPSTALSLELGDERSTKKVSGPSTTPLSTVLTTKLCCKVVDKFCPPGKIRVCDLPV